MSKILLIKPRFLANFENCFITQPMGLMYIGAMLKMAGYEPKIHDCAIDYYKDYQTLRCLIKEWQPDFIGISIIVTEVEQTKKIMAIIRETLPHVPVILGGPWPSANPEEAIKTLRANFVVLGEGEKVLPHLIDAINNNRSTDSLPGMASLVNGHVKINQRYYLTEDELNELPLPAWELLDHKIYAKMHSFAFLGRRPYMAIVTSRGCPYRCAYCHQTLGKVFRKRSVDSVLAEMEELHFKQGFNEFEIIDDCFNLDRERMHAILSGIINRLKGVKLYFPNGLRADMFEPEDMVLFKKAGTVSAVFAIETASPRLQKMLHKNLNIQKAADAIKASVKQGIYSTACFMIGLPTETYEEASASVEFALSSPLHRAFFFHPMPFAGTELAEMAATVIKNRYNSIDPRDINYMSSTLNISAMSDNELQTIFRRVYQRFYLNPRRICSMIHCYPRILALPRNALTTLMLIFSKRRSAF